MKKNNVLIMIDVQKGFLETALWGGNRNNVRLEENLKELLGFYRKQNLPIIHVQHLSTEERSPLRPGQEGANFMDDLGPIADERVFQKNVNSAFIGTNLEAYLKEQKISILNLVGLTTDHCVSTTARMGANLGFKIMVISDCTATFDKNLNGNHYPAELVHEVSLASLSGEFAEIISLAEAKR